MAQLDKKMIKYLTDLCRIECTEEEQESLLQDLKKILDYIEQLNEIDTENVLPCDHVLENMVNVEREDIVGEVMPREVFLSNAPAHVSGLIRVPTVIKQTPK